MAVLAATAVLTATAATAAEPTLDATAFERDLRPLVVRYCLDCHSSTKPKGDLDLEPLATLAEARRHPAVWQAVADQVAQREMPPRDKPQPSAEEHARLLDTVGRLLRDLALARAGDPGPVVVRRLSNAEYTYTIRDLTGVDSLDPAREFPVDGAAGEGFMNTGNALVMSPALLDKYLDAARDLATHAVLLPDGLRFSPHTSRRDWTDEIVGRIRTLYRRHTDPRGSTRVNLQGLVWETNEGGRIPLDRYFAALLEAREDLAARRATPTTVARDSGLNARYLATLFHALVDPQPSLPLDAIRARFRAATPADAPALVAETARWQQALWRFASVGHIGKVGGPRAWMEPALPLAPRQDIRLDLTNAPVDGTVTLRLVTGTAGDGPTDDRVLWERPRLTAPGRPDLLLRDVPAWARQVADSRRQLAETAASCLAAAAEVEAAAADGITPPGAAELAHRHRTDPALLAAWFDYLGLGVEGPVAIRGHFTNRMAAVAGYEFVRGWGSPETPSVFANASDRHVRIPGNLRPHGIAVHPSPQLQAAVGWRSPVSASLRVEATITHAHPECGNGVTWALELRRGPTRQRLAAGIAHGGTPVRSPPIESLPVRPGDLVSLLVGPRDGNHSCDLTAVDLILTPTSPEGTPDANPVPDWNLAREVSPDLWAGNPHPDAAGRDGVWHFYTEPVTAGSEAGPVIPVGSILARWRSTTNPVLRRQLALDLQRTLQAPPDSVTNAPDAALRHQLLAAHGPLFRTLLARRNAGDPAVIRSSEPDAGADPRFGRLPDGTPVDPASLVVQAPAVLDFVVPAELAEGSRLVATASLHPSAGPAGTIQVRALVAAPATAAPDPAVAHPDLPVVVADDGPARRRIEAEFEAFRGVFPAALAYTRIVPVDEVVTLTLFHREDEPLRRLMLDDAEAAELDRLWDELHYVSQDALTLVDAYAQLMEYATQDADPKVFEPLRQPIHDRAAAFRRRLVDTQPRHVEAVVAFAERAYRRPLRPTESAELRKLYDTLRTEELAHDDAVRLLLARVLASPSFLYRAEQPGPAADPAPVSDGELATRLSYFLWSSVPDAPLAADAAAGRLREPDVLAAQTRRMLRDPRVRRLAIEFGCQWLHLHDFDQLDEKSERHFPDFPALRGPMYEEAIRFFADFFRNDLPVQSLLDADHTFVNPALAAAYGIPWPGTPGSEAAPDDWRRVGDVRRHGRGGILGLAATLARQSGASRTSPILRGNWISEVLLGERLPRPPKDVPRLPEDEAATDGLTVRQLVERHSLDPRCAGCHVRIDPYGFALEAYDAIGRRRSHDLAQRPIETRARTADGAEFDGLDGLRGYLLGKRRDAFLRQFCRKLLGYALGRGVQLSDTPLLDTLRAGIDANGGHVGALVETIVLSPQFREIRGRDFAADE